MNTPPNSSGSAPLLHTHIAPSRGRVRLQLHELWDYHELLYFLTWRDIKVRYKQTALGVTWAVLQPLLTMFVFWIFFNRLGKIESDGAPYPLWSLTGLLPWNFLSSAISQASASLVSNANMIKKIYFPRLIAPISSVLSGIVDFGVSFVLLLILMCFFPLHLSWSLLLLPLFLLLAITTSMAVGIWLAALNVAYRDVRYAVPFLMQFWMFITPLAYPSSLIPEPWRTLYGLNPMVGVVEGFRWALLGTSYPGPLLLVSIASALLMLVSGVTYFRRVERTFADII